MATNYFENLGFGQDLRESGNVLAGGIATLMDRNRLAQEQAKREQAAALQFQNEQQKARAIQGAQSFYNALNAGNTAGALQIAKTYEQEINSLGDPSFTVDSVAQLAKTPQGIEQLKQMSLGMVQMAGGPEQFAKYTASQQVKPMTAYEQAQIDNERAKSSKKPFEQGAGSASGFVFDPNTGTYTASPMIAEAVAQAKAKADATGEKLDTKTIISLNDKVGAITKDADMIHNTANDITKLRKIGGGPASISIVYKFMKSLDPTSVVREGEFATAANAGGVPDNVMNIYNKLINGERLPESVIADFELTAQNLSDSAADAADASLSNYLDTFEGQLPDSLKSKLKSRVPKRFGVKEPAKPLVTAPQAAIDYLQQNPQFKEQFKAKYGYVPEGM